MKREDFKNALEQAKLNNETKWKLGELKSTRAAAVTAAPSDEKKCSKITPYRESDFLQIFLDPFSNSIKAARIPLIQWVSRFCNILTGKILKTFQDLPEADKASFQTVCEKLMATQNLTAEH